MTNNLCIQNIKVLALRMKICQKQTFKFSIEGTIGFSCLNLKMPTREKQGLEEARSHLKNSCASVLKLNQYNPNVTDKTWLDDLVIKTCKSYRTHADILSNTERLVINVLNRSYGPVLLTAVADFIRVLTFDNPITCVIPYSSIDGVLVLLAKLKDIQTYIV